MKQLIILNEDFFDDNDIDVDDEIEDNDIDNVNYTHYFQIYFNIPIMFGMDYEKYVK